jgi:RNA polymerase sigma-70 factor (ECF subfamily)
VVTDEHLAEAASRGDSNAFRMLVVRYQQLVFASIYKIVNDFQEAEDLTQEAFIKIFKALNNFRGESKLSTWFIKIAVNCALDYRRKQQRHSLELVSNDIFEMIDTGKDGLSDNDQNHPEIAFVNKESELEFQRHLEQIPGKYRQVLEKTYMDELSCREIADSEGVPVKTISSRLYRGRKLLRERQALKDSFKDSLQDKGGKNGGVKSTRSIGLSMG